MPDIQIERLTKTFDGGVAALKDVNFHVDDQEFVFLLGPSGAGKTTNLRLIAGLEHPTEGYVRIGGHDMTGVAPRDRNVAMVYDKHSLYPHLSVFENMAYPLRLRKMTDSEIVKRIGATAEILGIQQLLERRPTELSGGQQQRVAIGRALVRDANAYLMDEPISHLDAKLRAHMRVEFKKLQQEFSATILYVSHDQLEAMTMGDRIVVIDEGAVQQIGTPNEIFDRPANLFVAEFVGQPPMNTTDCELHRDGGEWHVRGGSFFVKVSEQWVNRHGLTAHAGKPLKLGFRPHRIDLVEGSQADEVNVESGRIYAVETLGSETIYDIEVGKEIFRVWTRNPSPGNTKRMIGDPICFRVDPEALYIFDAASGETLAQAGPALHPAA